MKKIIAIVLIAPLFACAPAFVDRMQGIHNDLRESLALLGKNDYEGTINEVTRVLKDIPEVDIMYGADTNYEYHTEKLESGWEKTKFAANVSGKSFRSISYYNLGKYGDAFDDANSVIDYCNKNKSTREDLKELCREALEAVVFVRGEVYRISKKDYTRAIRDFDWVVENGKKLGRQAYDSRALSYLGLGDFHTAYAHFDELIKQYPGVADYYAGRCSAGYEIFTRTKFAVGKQGRKEQEKKLDEIGADCGKALELDPNNKLAIQTAAYLLAYTINVR